MSGPGYGAGYDGYAIGRQIAALARLVDDAKRLSFMGGGVLGGASISRIEVVGPDLCAALNNVARELNALSRTLDGVKREPPPIG